MKLSIFCQFGLKTLVHAPNMEVFGGFQLLNEEWQQRNPKAQTCVETRHMTYRTSKLVSILAGCEPQTKKVH